MCSIISNGYILFLLTHFEHCSRYLCNTHWLNPATRSKPRWCLSNVYPTFVYYYYGISFIHILDKYIARSDAKELNYIPFGWIAQYIHWNPEYVLIRKLCSFMALAWQEGFHEAIPSWKLHWLYYLFNTSSVLLHVMQVNNN